VANWRMLGFQALSGLSTQKHEGLPIRIQWARARAPLLLRFHPHGAWVSG
ncbi:MAG: hypothetical protein ACI9WU_002842, partial [Myxococcota bacterium]